MSDPVLHKYFDFGDRALAKLTLESGERVILTILPNGFAVHSLHLFGIIPGRCLFGANGVASKQLADVLARDTRHLPPLPRAEGKHEDDASHRNVGTERPISLFTRLALTARDVDDLVRLFERARNTG